MGTKFKELLDTYKDEQVVKRLLELYPEEEKNHEGYYSALEKLRSISPVTVDMKIVLTQVVDKEFGDYVDIGGTNEQENNWAIEFRPWAEWLGMEITEGTLSEFESLDIVAHCLWELTWVAYSDEEVNNKWIELKTMSAEVDEAIENGTMEYHDFNEHDYE